MSEEIREAHLSVDPSMMESTTETKVHLVALANMGDNIAQLIT